MFAIAVVLGVLGVLLVGYLLLRFNRHWTYKLFDRTLNNERAFLPRSYELPRYFRLNQAGKADTQSRWPGWDGWYFFVIPEDTIQPVRMVRASIMTGLYGLEGIDNYSELPPSFSPFHVIEHLVLVTDQGAAQKKIHLSQRYLPKSQLEMGPKELRVAVRPTEPISSEKTRCLGRIDGRWPEYEMEFSDLRNGISLTLRYHGETLIWWADVPEVFTYFAAFGRFEGNITYKMEQAGTELPTNATYPLRGRGSFEHGFARKPFNFDFFYSPVKLCQYLVPSFRPIRYHYELLVGNESFHGGFMLARGFGLDFRNHGALYVDGEYQKINHVQIEYLDGTADHIPSYGPERPPVVFYRRWKVTAATDNGPLQYLASRDWPPSVIAKNMTYYNFSYEGTFQGQQIHGHGYGEYVHI